MVGNVDVGLLVGCCWRTPLTVWLVSHGATHPACAADYELTEGCPRAAEASNVLESSAHRWYHHPWASDFAAKDLTPVSTSKLSPLCDTQQA